MTEHIIDNTEFLTSEFDICLKKIKESISPILNGLNVSMAMALLQEVISELPRQSIVSIE